MKKTLFLVLSLLAFFNVARAQSPESYTAEIYGGYSYLREPQRDRNLNGFNAGGTVWLNGSKKIGLTGDYTFHTQSTTTSVAEFGGGGQLVQATFRTRKNTFQVGPTFRFRKGRVSPFVHVLAGVTRTSLDIGNDARQSPLTPTFSQTNFSMALGGGLDVDLTKSGRVALRVAKAEYFLSSLGDNPNNFRFSTGLVVRF
jgi:opacity protein-like surface antigen